MHYERRLLLQFIEQGLRKLIQITTNLLPTSICTIRGRIEVIEIVPMFVRHKVIAHGIN